MNGETPAPKKTRTWLWVLLGIVLFVGVLSVGCVAGAVWFFRQNLQVTDTADDSAMQQLDAVRAKFAGQQPLIQLVDGKPQLVGDRGGETKTRTPLKTLHVMAFDSDEGKLVNFSLPWWIIRMKSGPIRISAYQQGWDDRGVSFRVEDIEKHGPGIIVDVTEDGEGRVIIWAE
jgi:hypothetical protein